MLFALIVTVCPTGAHPNQCAGSPPARHRPATGTGTCRAWGAGGRSIVFCAPVLIVRPAALA